MEKEIKDVTVQSDNSMMVNALSIDAIAEQVQAVHKLMSKLMIPDVHYGVIEGTDKPTLLKPGAEKICLMFQLRPEYTITRINLPNYHVEYQIVCELFSKKTGLSWGQGVGSCSTLESKFRYRYKKTECPECGSESVIKGKEKFGGGYVCWKKTGGCGATWKEFTLTNEKIENPDIADQYNTVLKIGKKRALLDAAITATAASDIFTQDMDELLNKTFKEKEINPEPKKDLLTNILGEIILPCKTILEWDDKKICEFYFDFSKMDPRKAEINVICNVFKESIKNKFFTDEFYNSLFDLCNRENWSQSSIDEGNRMIVDMKEGESK